MIYATEINQTGETVETGGLDYIVNNPEKY